MILVKSVIVCVLFSAICCAIQLDLNDQCTLKNSDEIGKCRFVEDCPDIVRDVTEHSTYPTKCGLKDGKQLYCCPERKEIVLNRSNVPLAERTFFKSIKMNSDLNLF